jgi:tetratricopeptide (TPR) repeat protein
MPVGMQPSSAPSSVSTDSQLPGLTKKVGLLEKQFKNNPGNLSIKKQDAQANYDAGYAMMMSEKTNRKVRYRQALRYFRRTLKLDPQNADAAANKKLIEDIYKSMNIPIPQ